MKKLSLLLLLSGVVVLTACGEGHSTGSAGALTSEQIASDVLAAMDQTADPCNDFYRFACGGWLDTTELPADESRWSRSFSEIRLRNERVLREILEEKAEKGDRDPELAKLGDWWTACMDEEGIEAQGVVQGYQR